MKRTTWLMCRWLTTARIAPIGKTQGARSKRGKAPSNSECVCSALPITIICITQPHSIPSRLVQGGWTLPTTAIGEGLSNCGTRTRQKKNQYSLRALRPTSRNKNRLTCPTTTLSHLDQWLINTYGRCRRTRGEESTPPALQR